MSTVTSVILYYRSVFNYTRLISNNIDSVD